MNVFLINVLSLSPRKQTQRISRLLGISGAHHSGAQRFRCFRPAGAIQSNGGRCAPSACSIACGTRRRIAADRTDVAQTRRHSVDGETTANRHGRNSDVPGSAECTQDADRVWPKCGLSVHGPFVVCGTNLGHLKMLRITLCSLLFSV